MQTMVGALQPEKSCFVVVIVIRVRVVELKIMFFFLTFVVIGLVVVMNVGPRNLN